MHSKRTSDISLSCPGCGFRIFNRRYAKCERCGCALPAAMLLSEQERQALLHNEQERLSFELERARSRRAGASVRPAGWLSSSRTPTRPSSASGPTAAGDLSPPSTSSDAFTSGGGGVFDGGGASGSAGGESASPSSGDVN